MNKKFNTRNKFRYFIFCHLQYAFLWDNRNENGYWIGQNNKNAEINNAGKSSITLKDFCFNLEHNANKVLEVDRHDFLKFSRSKYNRCK